MLFLVISEPRPERPSDVAKARQGFWPWMETYQAKGICKHIYPRVGRGAVAIKTATASRPVRQTKTLPPTLAQRVAKVATRLAARTSSQSATNAPTRRRSPRPRW